MKLVSGTSLFLELPPLPFYEVWNLIRDIPQSHRGASHPNAASSGECLGVWAAARTETVGKEKEESGPNQISKPQL